VSELDIPLIAPKPTDLMGATHVTRRDDPQLAQAAKDFESVLLGKMMEEMHNTVQDSGLLEDSGSSQIQGMFWNFLAKDVADKGGVGLWKDLYDQWTRSPAGGAAAQGAQGAKDARAAAAAVPAPASEVLP
jgi:Rod binding domain-containing protein